MEYEQDPRPYEDDRDERVYERERSRSPRNDRRGDDEARARSASPNARDRMDDRGPPPEPRSRNDDDDPGAINPGSNLFVTGIHPRLSEEEVTRLFEKYGNVEKCNIMRDPHTRESRGFGFVNMVTPEEADAAREGLQGEVIEGRTLSIEKARRARPRTPTPGKYFGPPKREDFRGGRRGGFGGDRYEDRRGYGGRRDDYGGGSFRGGPRYGGGGGGGGDYYGDRRGDRRERDYGPPRGVDRYASSRDDRYGGERRGGGRHYDRDDRGAGGYGGAAEDSYGGGRSYDDRGDDRYYRR